MKLKQMKMKFNINKTIHFGPNLLGFRPTTDNIFKAFENALTFLLFMFSSILWESISHCTEKQMNFIG